MKGVKLLISSRQYSITMATVVSVEGHEAYLKAVEENKGKQIFAMFCGSKDANGESWCPDCVVAEPVLAKSEKTAKDAVVIHCGVGPRDFWKDQQNIFRKDPKLLLKSVPTLLKLGTPQRLVEAQCADESLVQMFFEDE